MCTGAAEPLHDVRVSVLSSTEIFVEWDFVRPCKARNGLITSYLIRIQPNDIPQTPPETEDLEITLTGLTPYTNYFIEVAAVNENGDVGVYSDTIIKMTSEARMLILSRFRNTLSPLSLPPSPL